MRRLTRRLQSWWWAKSHAEWDEPDETTAVMIADWIAAHKHPADCARGCQCEVGGDTT